MKVIPLATLKALNGAAVKAGYNSALADEFFTEFLAEAEADILFPVEFAFIHNDTEMRAIITAAKNKAGDGMTKVILDIGFEDFEALPEVEVEEEV